MKRVKSGDVEKGARKAKTIKIIFVKIEIIFN